MPIFVDHAGMNTLVSSSFDDTNTLTSARNTAVASIPTSHELAAINTHRNGPYGYSSWQQLRVSENPITRHHRETNVMSFVVQPGPIRNVLANGELRVRDRYSVLYRYTEPAVTQKAYPLVWNVGRHFKDEDGNVDMENPQRFSIISSYGNQQIAFANDKVTKLHKFDPNEENTEYVAIKDMYLENGLNKQDSPLTHWEFLQYRETVFPKPTQQYISQTRTRPNFTSFYRHNREDRTKLLATSPFGFNPRLHASVRLSQSTWPLDEHQEFLTRTYASPSLSVSWTDESRDGEGVLMTTVSQFNSRFATHYVTNTTLNSHLPGNVESSVANIDQEMGPSALYARRHSVSGSSSVSNPSGIQIYGTGSTITVFQGGALWEAGNNREVRNSDGTYTRSPKQPFYDTYENYVEDVKKYGKNYSIIPEFRMSSQVEDFKRTDGEIELDMFEITGGISGSENSSKSNFYEIYSNTDFLKNFELISDDHKDFTNGKVLSLRCKAIKKFLPYEGFYPCQRTVDISKRFYDSFKNNIKLYNANNVELDGFNYGRQMVMTPLFAPGVLFNTIKSGVAVDYPIITGSLNVTSGYGGEFTIAQHFDKRIPFEALIEPAKYLSNYKLTSNEPHPSGNLSASAVWDGQGDSFYSMMANNFLAESINFFLPNGQLSSVVSKKQKDIKNFEVGKVYGMRIKMRRSMDGTKFSVYHENSSSNPYSPPQDIIKTGTNAVRENFTMYSRPSAFGPPSLGRSLIAQAGAINFFDDDTSRFETGTVSVFRYAIRDSRHGFNFPFTPPYYHGEGWCEMWMTASSTTMTIKEIQNAITASFTRFDTSFNVSGSWFDGQGPQTLAGDRINQNAVQLSSSLNIFGVGTIKKKGTSGAAGSLVVDSGLAEENRWVIQTKFETPMLNFNHISGSDHLTLPTYGSGSVPRGMWHQYGRLPEENEGVFLQVGPIPSNYQEVVGVGGTIRNGEVGGTILRLSAVPASFNTTTLQTGGTVLRFHRNNERTTTTRAAGLKFEIDFDTSLTTIVRTIDGTDDCAKITCGINGLTTSSEVLDKIKLAIDEAIDSGDIRNISTRVGLSQLFIINEKPGTDADDQLVISDAGSTISQFRVKGVDPVSGDPTTNNGTPILNGNGIAAIGAVPASRKKLVLDLSSHLGFSGEGTKLGRLAQRKRISEAVVAVPFIEKEGRKKFFTLDKSKIDTYKLGLTRQNEDAYRKLTNGTPSEQIGRSVLNQIKKMERFIFPPSFDFINFDTDKVTPVAMYIFEFSHTLTQQDLQDIWQNLPPTIGEEMEVSEVAITHPLLKKELLGSGGEGGTNTIEMPDKLKWMVFKVKQRATSNYFKKTVVRNSEINTEVDSGNVTQDEFGQTSAIQYNWPYDFFSLVEMVRIDAEVEMGNADFSNYTDNIPNWNPVQAEPEKIEYVVGGLEDDPVPEIAPPEPVPAPAQTTVGLSNVVANPLASTAGLAVGGQYRSITTAPVTTTTSGGGSSNNNRISDRQWMKEAWYFKYKQLFNENPLDKSANTKKQIRSKHKAYRNMAEGAVRSAIQASPNTEYNRNKFNAKWQSKAARDAHERNTPTSMSVVTFFFPPGSEGPNKKRITADARRGAGYDK